MKPLRRSEFERLVRDGVTAIPERFRVHLPPVSFIVENESTPDQERGEGELLGLFEGPRLAELGLDPLLPPKITIFQSAHEAEAETLEQLAANVRDTVWHEFAHFLGMEEHEVLRAEERRRNPP